MPPSADSLPKDQTADVFEQIESRLSLADFTFAEVIRTWFYLDPIHAFYGDFNRVRNEFFRARSLLGRAPASTAVGASNAGSVAICAHVLGFKPRSPDVRIAIAHSPLQGSALDYGSAFSRGLTMQWAKGQRLYISGTASIDSAGRTCYVNDVAAQITESFRVALAMLTHHGFSMSDISRAIGYIPSDVDRSLVRNIWQSTLLIPFSFLQADICRPDLRFEIELFAEQRSC
jgi:enamine deaminase RidA (YjgF/YER057c/UK114 family)